MALTDDEDDLVSEMKSLFKQRVGQMTYERFLQCFDIAKQELAKEIAAGTLELSVGKGLPLGPIIKHTASGKK